MQHGDEEFLKIPSPPLIGIYLNIIVRRLIYVYKE